MYQRLKQMKQMKILSYMYDLEVEETFLINPGKPEDMKDKSNHIMIGNFYMGSHKQTQW